MNIKDFKEKLHKDYVLGQFSKTIDSSFIEIMAYSGFDFVILDMEHGPATFETTQNNIKAAQASGIVPIIRIPEINESIISKALDIGAYGIQVPNVKTKQDIEKIIKCSKFYPDGNRGVCRFVRSAGYSSIPKYEYFKKSNNTLCIIQLEGIEAIQNIEDILSIKGIDILFIGPYDLSQSLGLTGNIEHPEVENAMKKIVKKAKEKQIPIGTFVDTIENAKKWLNVGVSYISYSVDFGIFYEANLKIIENLKNNEK